MPRKLKLLAPAVVLMMRPASENDCALYAYFVGLPLYGILYVGLKLREYLREIEAALIRQES